MRKRKPPPLDSKDWWSVIQAVEDYRQRIDSGVLAWLDFNQELRAGRLRAMRRHANGSRELLAASAWDDLYVAPLIQVNFNNPSGRGRMHPGKTAVWCRPPQQRDRSDSDRGSGRQIQGQWIYIWRPDYEKIFLDVATKPAEPRARSPEVLENRGRKRVHDHAELGAVAYVLALQRKHGAPEKKPVDIVNELREWCQRNKQKVPADSTLYEIVSAALRIKVVTSSNPVQAPFAQVAGARSLLSVLAALSRGARPNTLHGEGRFVDCTTGRSEGFSLFRTRPT